MNSGKQACHYCAAQNELEDHRCQRCGRRLTQGASQPVLNTNLAPALQAQEALKTESNIQPVAGPQLVATRSAAVSAPSPRHAGFQASLFGPQEVNAQAVPGSRRQVPASPPPARPKRDKTAQQSLDFAAEAMGPRTLHTSVEAAIYCNAPVAFAPLRMMAAIFDLCVGVLAMVALLSTIHYTAPDIALSQLPLWFYAITTGVVFLAYRIFYCLANHDTAGVRWTGLQIRDFDGRKPSRKQRFHRLAGGCVSLIAVGLGVLWALYDEEKLTWHDHMSETFPTFASTELASRY